jgi:hypothetical protein
MEYQTYTVQWVCYATNQRGELSFGDRDTAMQFTTLFAGHVSVTVIKD